jgi:hypothetical protein
MKPDDHARSLKTLEENQRWLDEHAQQTVHSGDLPITAQPQAKTTWQSGTSDQQQ